MIFCLHGPLSKTVGSIDSSLSAEIILSRICFILAVGSRPICRARRPKRVFLSFLRAAGAPRIRKSPSFEPLTFSNRGAGRSFSYTRRVMAAASRLGSTSLVILTISPSFLSASTKDRNSRCGAAVMDTLIGRTRAVIRKAQPELFGSI